MENNDSSRDQVEQRQTRGMSNKSKISTDSPSKRQSHSTSKEDPTPISPLRMPDLPLPTPPPMANITMTSRIGYRRILGSRSTEFRSPILGTRSHSMDFGYRGNNMYGIDPRRAEPNRRNFDDRKKQHFEKYDDLNYEFVNKNYAKDKKLKIMAQKQDCFKRSHTLDSRSQVFRENRANTVEFMSPILARAYLYHREGRGESYDDRSKMGVNRHQAALTDQLGLSPLPRHKNTEYLSERLEDFDDYPIYPHLHTLTSPETTTNKDKTCLVSEEHRSKYFSRDSVLSNELEEVRTLNSELQKKYIGESTEDNIGRLLRSRSNSETSPEYYSVFFNDHYISDIDENEEIKEFICGYKSPERRYSDQSERSLQKSSSARNISDYPHYQTTTLPSSFKTSSTKQCSKRTNKNIVPNTSAFAVHHTKQSILKSKLRTQSAQHLCSGRVASGSSDNLSLHTTKRERRAVKSGFVTIEHNTISKSSDPIEISGVCLHGSDLIDQNINTPFSNSSATLPISSAHSHHSSSVSSIKSSDYYSFVPLVTSSVKKVEFSGDSTGKVIKSPQRTVVKLAKIRIKSQNFGSLDYKRNETKAKISGVRIHLELILNRLNQGREPNNWKKIMKNV